MEKKNKLLGCMSKPTWEMVSVAREEQIRVFQGYLGFRIARSIFVLRCLAFTELKKAPLSLKLI